VDKIRILIVDDHEVVREGLKAFIAPRPALEVVGEAENGRDAISCVERVHPDVILMDLVMPVMDGIEATRTIKQQIPDARILILTSFAEDERVVAAIKAGALGYLLKDSSPQELEDAIQDVYRGESSLPPRIARTVIRELNKPVGELKANTEELTEREVEILKLVAQGLSNQEIANRMSLSAWTVRSHISNILSKLHLENRTQAALYALRTGLAVLKK